MTLILKLALDIVNIHMCTKNEVPTFNRQTDSQTDRQTDATEIITYPHTRMVISLKSYRMLSLDSISCLWRLAPMPVTGTTRAPSVVLFKSHFWVTRLITCPIPDIRGILVRWTRPTPSLTAWMMEKNVSINSFCFPVMEKFGRISHTLQQEHSDLNAS